MLNIYLADLTGLEDFYDEKVNILHQERAEKLSAYKMPADRIRGLGAGLLLEKGLEDYLGTGLPKDENGRCIIRYGYGSQGKPYLKDYPEAYFNLSHSGKLAVLAVSHEEVGIDVQEFRGLNEKISKRFYHAEEVKSMEEVSDTSKREILFYKIWSGKEAYIKYTGKGIRQELSDFYCDTSSGKVIENGKILATCLEVDLDYPNYCCNVVSGTHGIKIDKIMKIVL